MPPVLLALLLQQEKSNGRTITLHGAILLNRSATKQRARSSRFNQSVVRLINWSYQTELGSETSMMPFRVLPSIRLAKTDSVVHRDDVLTKHINKQLETNFKRLIEP